MSVVEEGTTWLTAPHGLSTSIPSHCQWFLKESDQPSWLPRLDHKNSMIICGLWDFLHWVHDDIEPLYTRTKSRDHDLKGPWKSSKCHTMRDVFFKWKPSICNWRVLTHGVKWVDPVEEQQQNIYRQSRPIGNMGFKQDVMVFLGAHNNIIALWGS